MKVSKLHSVFEEIFLINLEREHSKLIKTFHHLHSKGIKPTIWKATDGYNEQNQIEYEQYLNRPLGDIRNKEFSKAEIYRGSKFIDSLGAWGILKSYEAILEYALKNKISKFLILEDDVILHENFETKLDGFINNVGNNWKVLLFGASQYDWTSVDIEHAAANGYYIPQIGHTLGAFAVGLEMEAAQIMLEEIRKMESPVDFIPMGQVFENFSDQSYVSFPNIIIPDVSVSAIREPRDQKRHSEKMKWVLNQFKFPVPKPIITIVFEEMSCVQYLNIGEDSELYELFHINFLYFTGERLLPVHSSNSNAFNLKVNSEVDLNKIIDNLMLDNLSDYIIKLRKGHVYNIQIFASQLSKLILKGEESDHFELIKIKLNEYDLTNSELVSIIIPTYNRPYNLARAIDSVLKQTYENIELIIVDDNNPGTIKDETKKVVNSYLKDSRVRYVAHSKNCNGATARNTGIMESKGKYIALLDDDDIYLPNKIGSCLKVLMEQSDNVGGVYGGYIGWNSLEEDQARYKSGNLTEDLLTLSFKNHYLNSNTALYKRSALLKINGYDDSFKRHQDLEMNLRYFEHYEIDVVRQIVTHLRPVEPENSNRLTGQELFKLKIKFLLRFKHIINTFPISIQDLIYQSNWEEARSCFERGLEFLKYSIDQDKTGILRYLALSDDLGKIKTDILLQRNESNIAINHLEKELKELKSQNEWYAETYNHLPKWFLKIGAIFRRWPFGNKNWI